MRRRGESRGDAQRERAQSRGGLRVKPESAQKFNAEYTTLSREADESPGNTVHAGAARVAQKNDKPGRRHRPSASHAVATHYAARS